jgi:hypothetical protein
MTRRLYFPWLKRLFASSRSCRRSAVRSRRPSYRPALELLEDRSVPSFVTAINTPTGASPNGMALGDFNHDGKLDVVTVSNGNFTNAVNVQLGNGDGTFQAPTVYTPDANPVAVAVGDLNGDGKLDLVVVNHDGNDVSIFLGNGNGTFQSAANYAVGTSPDCVALGDFNGDGSLDLAVGNSGSGNLSILLGNGNGTFGLASTVSLVSDEPTSVAVGDFNRDGKLDLVTVNGGLAGHGFGYSNVLLGNGNGTFQSAVQVKTGFAAGSVAVADFNGDGKPDIAVGCAFPSRDGVNILLGNGNGTFKAFKKYSAGGTPALNALIVADVNGDGHPDIVTANGAFGNNSVSVLLNNGNGTLAAPLLDVADVNPIAVAAGNFLGGSKLDLVVANHDTSDLSVLPGNENGTFMATQSFVVGIKTGALVAADFNGDGVTDLAVAHIFVGPGSPSTINILTNNGDGTFTDSANLTTGAPASDLVVGDFNGDGKMDLAVSSTDSSSNPIVAVFLGNGNGTFKKPIDSLSTNALANLAVGDFNGDGKLDLVGTDGPDNLVDVMLGNGNGTFGAATNFATGTNPNSVVVADFNGDGRPDLAVDNVGDNTVGVLFGNGNGSFTTQTAYALNNSDPTAVAAGDLNGDGHPDLVVTHFQGFNANVDVFLNNGDGTFAAPTTYDTGGSLPVAVAIADLNGDGVPDLLLANNFSDNVAVLFGNGNGTFGSPTVYAVGDRPANTSPTGNGIAIADFNRDGQLDVAVSDSNAGTVTALLTPVSTHLIINAPTLTTAGASFSITVTAVDGLGMTKTGFTGKVHFSSNDPLATLPADYTFVSADHGVHTFTGVILGKAGARVIAVHNVSTPDIAGSFTVQVNPGAATHFAVSAPASAVAGTAFTITVTALDAFGNVATGYRGTVTFSSSDGSASLPGNYTFVGLDHGKHSFTVTLNTTGSQTVTAEDTAHNTIKGTATVQVNAHSNRRSSLGGDGGPDPAAMDALFAADGA